MNDEWADRFRFDLHAAQAIFFVGYSLADLDVRRLLLEEELREKSFFILKENPNAGDAHRANSFGALVAIGVDAFASEIRSFVSTYVLPPDSSPINHCIRPFVPQNPSEPVQDRYLFELVLSGKLRSEFIPQSFLGQTVYVGVRTALTRFAQVLEPGVGVIFLHSNLGNGKSIAMTLAQYAAFQKGFNVYSLADRGETLANVPSRIRHLLLEPKHPLRFATRY